METVARIEQANPHPVMELTLGGKVRRVRALGLRESARWWTAHREFLVRLMAMSEKLKPVAKDGEDAASVPAAIPMDVMMGEIGPITDAVLDYCRGSLTPAEIVEIDTDGHYGEMFAAIGPISQRASRFPKATEVVEAPSEITSAAEGNNPNGDGPTS